MTAGLLERDAELRRLRETLRGAGQGRGSVVLVSGDAGIGKTVLVRGFAREAAAKARVLVGACDDLVTPRTLGPFRDMARDAGGALAEAVEPGAGREAVFGAVHQELAGRPTVMVVEDVHWADDATLDVLRYLAWRIPELPCALVLTYREDELGDDHPLRRVLGALPHQEVRRLGLRPLSPAAVEELAGGHGADAAVVLAVTAGNPFFVSEVLANPGVEVPATVRDAVLARLGGLSEPTQRALELLSTVPGQVERWLVERLLGDQPAALDEAERRGVLEADPGHVWFRHELARRAIERQLSSTARVACNRRVLAELARRPGVELSRLSHHAHQAGEPEAVVRHGLAAAREAAGAGAFREALAHYELVLRWSGQLAAEQRAAVLEESVWVLYNLSRFDEAVARAGQVVALAERTGDPARLGQALTTLSRMRYMVNDPAGSEAAVTRAVALLEPLSDQPRLARAYTYLAAILKLTDRPDEAIALARRSLELGERTGQRDVVAHSLNYLGYALLDLGDPGGAAHLRRSAEVARVASHYEYAQRAYTNLVEGLYRLGRFGELDQPLADGLAYAREYGFASHEYNLEAHRCMLLTLRGRWDEAEAGLRRLLAGEDPGVLASFGLSALGRLLARKGDPAAGPLLERAWRTATRTNSVQAIALAGIARVEAAWLAGDHRAAAELAGSRWTGPPAGAPSATGASCCATWPAAGTRSTPPPAAPRSSPSASRGTGRARPRCGGRSAPPTSTPSSWPPRAAARSCWRRWRRSTALGPWPRPTWSAGTCAGWASPASPAAPARAPAPTRPASPTASSRSSASSPTASPTPRSPTSWWCRSAPSTTTSPPSWPSSTSPPAARPPGPPPTWVPR